MKRIRKELTSSHLEKKKNQRSPTLLETDVFEL